MSALNSSIKVSFGGTTTGTTNSNPPTLYCDNIMAGIPDGPNSIPGAANSDSSSGAITSGRIFLNSTGGNASIENLSRTKLVVVLAHEIGHLLGLGHSHSTNALMWYDVTYKTNIALSQDDIDGMSYLYPSDEFKNNKFAGCGLIKAMSSPPAGGVPLLPFCVALLLPVLVFAKLRFSKPSPKL